jgi:hypothetical protein
MDFKNFTGMNALQWWLGMIAIGTAIAVAAIAAHSDAWAFVGIGIAIWGVGEWRNHPIETELHRNMKVTNFPFNPSIFGIILDILGVGLIGWGGYRLLVQ